MNVRELIDRLLFQDPDATVLLATQPNWPLQFTLCGVVSSGEREEDLDIPDEPCEHLDREAGACHACRDAEPELSDIVYLVEGNSYDHPYAPKASGTWRHEEAHTGGTTSACHCGRLRINERVREVRGQREARVGRMADRQNRVLSCGSLAPQLKPRVLPQSELRETQRVGARRIPAQSGAVQPSD